MLRSFPIICHTLKQILHISLFNTLEWKETYRSTMINTFLFLPLFATATKLRGDFTDKLLRDYDKRDPPLNAGTWRFCWLLDLEYRIWNTVCIRGSDTAMCKFFNFVFFVKRGKNVAHCCMWDSHTHGICITQNFNSFDWGRWRNQTHHTCPILYWITIFGPRSTNWWHVWYRNWILSRQGLHK